MAQQTRRWHPGVHKGDESAQGPPRGNGKALTGVPPTGRRVRRAKPAVQHGLYYKEPWHTLSRHTPRPAGSTGGQAPRGNSAAWPAGAAAHLGGRTRGPKASHEWAPGKMRGLWGPQHTRAAAPWPAGFTRQALGQVVATRAEAAGRAVSAAARDPCTTACAPCHQTQLASTAARSVRE